MQVNFITASSPVSDTNMHLYSEKEQPIGDVLDFCSVHMLELFFNVIHLTKNTNILILQCVTIIKYLFVCYSGLQDLFFFHRSFISCAPAHLLLNSLFVRFICFFVKALKLFVFRASLHSIYHLNSTERAGMPLFIKFKVLACLFVFLIIIAI